MTRVPVDPKLLQWAREHARLNQEDLTAKAQLKKLPEWESGAVQPTLKQLEAFANAVHVPVGYLFLSHPPEETIPIPDFRTFAGQTVTRPSPNLLDTIYTCQERQSWYQEFARINSQPELPFIGSATLDSSPETVAAQMSETLGFHPTARRQCSTWAEALRLFIRQADDAGILVMVSGTVMGNNHRSLDLAEFRGFALCDPLAPLIFINGKDSKAAQMFTLAHELAHLWLGASAVSNLDMVPRQQFQCEEVWCNAVAAELLVPLTSLKSHLQKDEPLPDALARLARTFKVGKLVILRRLFDAGWLTRERFDTAWTQEMKDLQAFGQNNKSGGGDFYRTLLARVSHRFAHALVVSTLEGQTLYRDAFRLLRISKTETFNQLGREMGVMG